MAGVQDFYKTARNFGFARKNLFRIDAIQLDGSSFLYYPNTKGNLYLYLRNGTIPARNIRATNVWFKSFNYNVPTVAEYPEAAGNWSVEFFSDEEYVLRTLLERWSVANFDEHTSTTSAKWWNSSMDVVLLNNEVKSTTQVREGLMPSLKDVGYTKKYRLMGIYPSNLGSINYEAGDGGNLVTMSANIGFQYVISEDRT